MAHPQKVLAFRKHVPPWLTKASGIALQAVLDLRWQQVLPTAADRHFGLEKEGFLREETGYGMPFEN